MKKNVLFFLIGPPNVSPYCPMRNGGTCRVAVEIEVVEVPRVENRISEIAEHSAVKSLVPDLVTTSIWPPACVPYSASYKALLTRYSSIAS